MVGVFGKHAAFGDFLSHGLSPQFQAGLEPWIGVSLTAMRDRLGDEWTRVYDAAPPLRFWIGGSVFGTPPQRGVLCASRDKVGRRFPLLMLDEAASPAPPVLETEQEFYQAAEMALQRALAEGLESAADLAAMVQVVEVEGNVQTALWATNPGQDVAGLLAAVSVADHQRAAAARSYWWVAGNGTLASTTLTCHGMPDPDGLAWLMAGSPVTAPEPQNET